MKILCVVLRPTVVQDDAQVGQEPGVAVGGGLGPTEHLAGLQLPGLLQDRPQGEEVQCQVGQGGGGRGQGELPALPLAWRRTRVTSWAPARGRASRAALASWQGV